MQKFYDKAIEFIGLQEIAGEKHNGKILDMFKVSGHAWVQDDETPWCAAFIGAVIVLCGATGTRKLNARSYLDWGVSVPKAEARRGDIVVLWRKRPDGPYGHVGFVDRIEGNKIYILGGNQGNAVNISPYPIERVLGFRRLKPERTSPSKSTTIQASVAGMAATGLTGATTAIGALDPVAQYIILTASLIAALGFFWIIRERLKKWAEGDR